MESKQTLMFRIYQILQEYSDCNHPLKQQDIIDILEKDYDMTCERQAVSRNFSFLKECGIEIYSDRKGSYLVSRDFEESELRLLIDSVLSSKHINPKYTKELINRLINLGGKHFKARIKNIYSIEDWNKTENKNLLYYIDLIDEAIEKGQKIKFKYNKYGIDKKFHVTAEHIVSPYQLVLNSQRYYLLSKNEKWQNLGYYRVEKITDLKILNEDSSPITTIEEFKNGINYKDISSCHPYMFSDKPQKCEIKAEKWMIDPIIDWFGFDINIVDNNDETINVSLTTSLQAMEYWAMQYGKSVEVISPLSLREKVKEDLSKALDKYNN